MSAGSSDATEVDLTDPDLSQAQLAAENSAGRSRRTRQGRYSTPGTRAEKKAERQVAACFVLTFLSAVAFAVVYVAWPWELDDDFSHLYTPLLGVTMGLALFSLGAGAILWAKKLMPEEEAVQVRHDSPSPDGDRRAVGAQLLVGLEGTGIGRRKLLQRGLGLGALGMGVLAVMPLGAMIKPPGNKLFTTSWRSGVRLVRLDGSPIRPADMRAGSMETVFPGVPNGTRAADSATMLIRFRPDQEITKRPGREDWNHGDFYAYSKICTHAGCPVSLYEQQTQRMLCPCHQSQFLMTDGARPVFGPATRSLPQLPIELDSEASSAESDYETAVGPAFWNWK